LLLSAIATTPVRTARNGTLIWLSAPPPAPPQLILAVEFVSSDGRIWKAIGGGDTLAAAVASARGSCPDDASWQPLEWSDLYGD
jgi:hypothetical protein